MKIEIYPVDGVIQPHSFLSAFKQPRPGLAVMLIFISSNSSHCFKTTRGKSSHRILVTAIRSGNESFSPFSIAIDWAAGCITCQRLNSERSFSHMFACSVHSDNRAQNSDGGGVKSYAWENKRRLGREGRFPSPFSLPSFFFLVNFSPSLYHLNARNRLLICRSICSIICIFLLMEHWSLLLSLLSLFQEFRSWGQRKEMWAEKKKQQRGGGVAVRANRLSPFLPSRRTPSQSNEVYGTIHDCPV